MTTQQATLIRKKISEMSDINEDDIQKCISSDAIPILAEAIVSHAHITDVSEIMFKALKTDKRINEKVVCLYLLQKCCNINNRISNNYVREVHHSQNTNYAILMIDELLRNDEISQFSPEFIQEMFKCRNDDDFFYKIVCKLFIEEIKDYLDLTQEIVEIEDGEFLPASFRKGFIESLGNIVRLSMQFRKGYDNIEENFILKLSDRISRIVEKIKVFSQKFYSTKSRETYGKIIILKINNFKINCKKILEKYLNEFDKTKINLIYENIKSYLLRVINNDIQNDDPSPNQRTFLIFSYLISIMNLFKDNEDFAKTQLNGFISSFSKDFEELLKQDTLDLYEQLCVLPKQIYLQIQNNTTESYKCFQYATSAFLTPIFYANCTILEDLVQLEILLNSRKGPYPAQKEELFDKYIKNDNSIIDYLKNDMDNWLQIIYKLIDMIVPYLSQIRGIPGCICGIEFTNFVLLKEWKWKEIPHIKFPEKPQDVCTLISVKLSLIQQFEQYKYSCNSPKCLECKSKNATIICPECRKLVLCDDCKSFNKCPICNFVFN